MSVQYNQSEFFSASDELLLTSHHRRKQKGRRNTLFKVPFFAGAQKLIKSGGILCLRIQAGRIGPIEAISKRFTRFLGWLILLDFREKGVYAF